MGARAVSTVGSRGRRGFTLVEAVATLMVIGVLSVVSSRLVLDGAEQYVVAVTRARLSGEMSSAMERMTIELRSVPIAEGSDPPGADLVSVGAGSVSWNSGDGARALGLVGTDLVSTTGGVGSVLLRDVAVFSVRALDETHGLMAGSLSGSACLSVHRLEITVTCERDGVEETIRTLVFLRAGMAGGAS